MLTGLLVRGLGELADQLLEQVTHLRVGHGVGVQVDLGELAHDQQQPVLLRQGGDLVLELEPLEDVDVRREPADVVEQVRPQPVGVELEAFEVVLGGVVEAQPVLLAYPRGEHVRVVVHRRQRAHLIPGPGELAVQAPHDGHRQDHRPVLVGPVDTAELVRDAPHEVAERAHLILCFRR